MSTCRHAAGPRCLRPAILRLSLWAVSLASPAAEAAAPAHVPDIEVEARVIADAAGAPRQVQGTLKIRGWQATGERCLYLPYEDPNFGEDRGVKRRLETFSARGEAVVFGGGSLKLRGAGGATLAPGSPPQVARLQGAADELVVEFEATIPRLPSAHPDDWFYDGFLPLPMRECLAPGLDLDPEYYRTPLTARYRGRLTVPVGWQYVGPGVVAGSVVTFDQSARQLAFALGRDLQRREFSLAGVPVEIYFHTPGFDDLAMTAERVLPELVAQFGAFPFANLKILETTELQTHGLPGLIAINRPAQAAFSHVQRDWLHWREWMLALQLARQWYGGSIAPPSPDDDWLTSGIADFATLEALSADAGHFDLFGKGDGGRRIISFNYLQFSEVSAALLMGRAPFATLTTADLKSKDPSSRQHPLLFVKQALALRQLMHAMGKDAFRAFLREVTAASQTGTLAPAEFAAALHGASSLATLSTDQRQALDRYLREWWTSSGWPDFALEDFDVEALSNGRYRATVTARQKGSVDFPPLVGIADGEGKFTYARAPAPKTDGLWRVVFETATYPVRAVVDPTRESFDADRFDNASDWSGVHFFPGTANTLRDDAYTVGWLPYAFRRPGEPFSLGVQAALLRYVQSGLFIRAETAPSEKVGAFEARQSYQVPSRALAGLVALRQNYDHEREAEASVTRYPLADTAIHVGLGVKLRHKELVGDDVTSHQTGGLGLTIRPSSRSRVCGYMFEGEVEQAPKAMAKHFSYERKQGAALIDCNITTRINLALRGFAGALYAEGEPPEQALFKPTELKEARLRLDIPGLARTRKLSSAGVDLFFPFYVPIPSDIMLLARQMRWRIFFDYGHAYDLDLDYRSHGFGFSLPFGGDLAGAGSLAFTRVSVLAILESRVGDRAEHKPSIVFDVSGEL